MIPLSVLDLSPIVQGGSPGQSLRDSRNLARAAERLGFARYWMAEHHNMTGIASAATAVALAYVGEGTSTIRLGAGGVMLPNHAPLISSAHWRPSIRAGSISASAARRGPTRSPPGPCGAIWPAASTSSRRM